jgi:hypothetical protein
MLGLERSADHGDLAERGADVEPDRASGIRHRPGTLASFLPGPPATPGSPAPRAAGYGTGSVCTAAGYASTMR